MASVFQPGGNLWELQASRLQDLYDILGEFGVTDRQAALILVAVRVVPESYLPASICVETDHYGDSRAFWGAYSREASSLGWLRRFRPRFVQAACDRIMDDPTAHSKIYLEPAFKAPVRRYPWLANNVRSWPYVMQSVVRLRVDNPRTTPPTTGQITRIKAVVDRLLYSGNRDRLREIHRLDENLLQRVRLLQTLNVDLRDWSSLYHNLSVIQSAVAWVRGAPEPEDEDRAAALRVVLDSVPVWTWRGLAAIGEERTPWKTVRKQLYALPEDEAEAARREILRLRRAGIVGYGERQLWLKDPLAKTILREALGSH